MSSDNPHVSILVLATCVAFALPARANVDSGTSATVYLHGKSKLVLVEKANIHDANDCTLEVYSAKLRLEGQWVQKCLDDLVGDKDPETLGIVTLEGIEKAAQLRRIGLRYRCVKKKPRVRRAGKKKKKVKTVETCGLWRGRRLAIETTKGSIGADLFVASLFKRGGAYVFVETEVTSGGMTDPKTGECVENCGTDDTQQKASYYPRPKRRGADFYQVVAKGAGKLAKKLANAGRARGRKALTARSYESAANELSMVARLRPRDVTSALDLAEAYLGWKKPKKMIAALRKAALVATAETRKQLGARKAFSKLTKAQLAKVFARK